MSKQLAVGWQKRSLASLGEYVNGFAFNDEHWTEIGLPIVRIAQITGSQGIVDRFPGRLPDTYRLEDGDLIFSWSGTLAVVRWLGGSAWLNQHLFKVLNNPDVDKAFLFHLLQQSVAEMNKRTHGSTMKHIKRGELEEFVIEIPIDTIEQAKIAAVLDTLDTAIHQTDAIVEKLKQVKQGLLHDLLTRGVDANGELRPSYDQAPYLYQESRLGWIPKDWTLRSVASLGEIKSGSTPSRGKADRYFHPEGTPWVKTLDLNEDVIFKTDECITVAALRESSCSILPVGSVLIAMYGGWEQIGRTAMLGVPSATNQAISTVTINDPEVVPEYVLRALQHGRPRWKRVAASTRKDPNITKVDVETFELPMPSTRAEQEAIVTRFRALLNRLAIEQLELHKRQEEKAGAMDDLLTGRVRVTPLLAQ
jgi:type I restriction enzyme S subunit